ncbi:hypothetical protein GCM10022255_059950 [Dactylosporangium darangshiense]|uniref:Uncharacterized protein n=1 Tax=Dactylosporangium darangshiense TaxID=579108 RepID=A0ABP8DFF1_9ACTN
MTQRRRHDGIAPQRGKRGTGHLGVTTVSGNVGLGRTTANVLAIALARRQEIPVAAEANRAAMALVAHTFLRRP